MKKVIVVGGGLSGLSTAVFLANKGIKSHLIEASPKLGGIWDRSWDAPGRPACAPDCQNASLKPFFFQFSGS